MLSLFAAIASCERWAVLIAGSNGYSNYRHQADIYNMYTQLVNRGFDAEHIVQMCYDDIATSSYNPYKGEVFHTLQHVNIYPGASTIDYSNKKVTASNFFSVLTSLPSTSDDYVYVYYDNHGGPGLLGVPDGCGNYIFADELSEAFTKMSNQNQYKYLLFGLEACYSGSVASEFTAPNMVTITAANDSESSYAAVWDNKVSAYLSNEFSNYWMAFLDENYDKTIGDLYTTVKSETTGSHVCFFGDESMKSLQLSLFLGTPNKVLTHNKDLKDKVPAYLATKSHLMALQDSINTKEAGKARIALQDLIAQQNKLEMTLEEIVRQLNPASVKKCLLEKPGKLSKAYFEVVKYFTSKYGVVHGDLLPRFTVFVNLANKYSVAEIKAAIDAIC